MHAAADTNNIARGKVLDYSIYAVSPPSLKVATNDVESLLDGLVMMPLLDRAVGNLIVVNLILWEQVIVDNGAVPLVSMYGLGLSNNLYWFVSSCIAIVRSRSSKCNSAPASRAAASSVSSA